MFFGFKLHPMNSIKNHIKFSSEVDLAIKNNKPVVALESAILAHGMPYPDNLKFSKKAETVVREGGAVPATIAIIDKKIRVGLNDKELEFIADKKNTTEKVALRDIGYIVANKLSGATTVSATMHIAHLAGIKVFATGGIGGVHRNAENTFDVSQDLIALSKIPIIVISAGAKAILDLPKTLEYLETYAVPVIGYKTEEFPAFYSRQSGCSLNFRCDSPKQITNVFHAQKKLKIYSALLVSNPVPAESEIPKDVIDKYIDSALKECEELQITGKAVTPFLLQRIVESTDGRSLKTNIALALNNVQLAAKIARAL